MDEKVTNLMVLSGPSGCGKSTLIERFLHGHPDVDFCVSHTTRTKRKNEREGRDYFFVSREEFERQRRSGKFIEWAEVHGNLYGTSHQELERRLAHSSLVVLDIDVQGANSLKKTYPLALYVFISPPSLAELERRLSAREQKSGPLSADIRSRLRIAREELRHYHLYDYIVINDSIETAGRILEAIYTAFMNSRSRKQSFIEKILEGDR